MSGAKSARFQSSIVNRTNICGGNKKAGIVPRVGWFMTSNTRIKGGPQSLPLKCVASTTIQTQKYGYSAVHSGHMG